MMEPSMWLGLCYKLDGDTRTISILWYALVEYMV